MPVGLRLSFPNNTVEDYDKVCAVLNFPADWPDGLLAHSSYNRRGSLVVTDVWQSRADFDRFVADRLQTAMGEALGDRASAPEIVEGELHTFYSLDAASS